MRIPNFQNGKFGIRKEFGIVWKVENPDILKSDDVKPPLHQRFFARAGDANFSNFVASPARDKITRVATLELATRRVKKSQEKGRQS